MHQHDDTRILLLEDSDIDADLICRALDKMNRGFHIERARIRQEFERSLQCGSFDLVLADYSIPGISGTDALDMVRQQDTAVPFVYVSGVLGEDFATEALRAGATDYVTKKHLARLPMVVQRALVEASERHQRKFVTQALLESEERFRVMADAAPALIWEADARGEIIFANQRFLTALGIAGELMVEKGWREVIDARDWPEFDTRYTVMVANGGVLTMDVRVRTADDAVRWIRCECRPRRVADQRSGYVGCGVDVTDTKLARDTLEAEIILRTEQLRIKDEALRQAQKMEAIGQLTGGIAHDFNNMLAGILGSAELLDKRLQDQRYQDCGRYVLGIVTAANRAAALTQRLLAFSRQQTLDVHSTDIGLRLRSISDLLRSTIGPSIHLSSDIAVDLWPALTDPNQFESAMLNLAINARDAMTDGGTLTLHGTNVTLTQSAAAHMQDLRAGDYVRVSVTDTGIGMDKGTMAKAIDPFFTTKPIGQGTGLGLSMVYGFMSQSGGHLEIESTVDVGTTVSLLLPRTLQPALMTASVENLRVPEITQLGTILLVEDEEIIRMLVTDYLQELGYTVLESANAEHALVQLAQQQPIDLLLTDVGLPGMDGRQLVLEARKLRPELSVIFVTGYADGAGLRSDLVSSNMDLIAKPFKIETLAKCVAALLLAASTKTLPD